jgi:hypothetical protein
VWITEVNFHIRRYREGFVFSHLQPAIPGQRAPQRCGQPARMALAKHIGAITVGPDDAGDIAYKGEFKLLGDDCVRWDGAEGQNRTGYAGLFRAALYQ